MRSKKTALAMLALLFTSSGASLPVQASSPYHWLVTIKTHDYPDRFSYAGSKLNPLIKCKITYKEVDSNDEETPYKTIWYCDRKASGLERFNSLSRLQGSAVALKITHDSTKPSVADYQVAANASLRVLIDLRIHQCRLTAVDVPDDAWTAVTEAFANEHYRPVSYISDTPFQAKAVLRVEDLSGSHSELFSYCPNN